MKIGLITTDSLVGHGIRSISSYLKSYGHQTISLFLARIEFYLELSHDSFIGNKFYDLLEIFNKCDIIGISCCSFTAFEAIHIIKKLKILSKPIIWGGIHATLCPEFCINYVDMVCIGEGEKALLDLINRIEKNEDIYTTPNFWIRKNNQIIKNPPRELITNLDSLPTPDYNFEDQYIFNGKRITLQQKHHFEKGINIHSIYGCPHKCTYCSNVSLRRISSNNSQNWKLLRKKSISKMINEIEEIVNKINPNVIHFDDDTFFIRTLKEIKEFSQKYKKINKKFTLNVSPTTINEKKLELLLEAGLETIEMGIQSGSDRINKEIFKRNVRKSDIIKAANIIDKYLKSGKLIRPPLYHLIIYNTYETPKDTLESLKILDILPKPFRLLTFNLQFLPGTELYQRALQDSLIKNPLDNLYYLNQITHLHRIDKTKDIISIDDIIILMKGNNSYDQYGHLKTELVKDFLKNENSIHSPLKVIIDKNFLNFLNNVFLFDDKLKNDILYMIRVIAFLRQKYHKIKEYKNIKYIETNSEDQKVYKTMVLPLKYI